MLYYSFFSDSTRNSNSNDYAGERNQRTDESIPLAKNAEQEQDNNLMRKVGSQISYWIERELGQGNSTVYEGEFTRLKCEVVGCAVKRIIKATGPLHKQKIKEVMEEIKIWIELTKCAGEGNNLSSVVQCFGYEENPDFW